MSLRVSRQSSTVIGTRDAAGSKQVYGGLERFDAAGASGMDKDRFARGGNCDAAWSLAYGDPKTP